MCNENFGRFSFAVICLIFNKIIEHGDYGNKKLIESRISNI